MCRQEVVVPNPWFPYLLSHMSWELQTAASPRQDTTMSWISSMVTFDWEHLPFIPGFCQHA